MSLTVLRGTAPAAIMKYDSAWVFIKKAVYGKRRFGKTLYDYGFAFMIIPISWGHPSVQGTIHSLIELINRIEPAINIKIEQMILPG